MLVPNHKCFYLVVSSLVDYKAILILTMANELGYMPQTRHQKDKCKFLNVKNFTEC